MEAWARSALATAKKRSLRLRLGFDLTLDDLAALAKRAGGRCEVTGVPFAFAEHPGASRRPFVPSIDRRDSTVGYVRKNCRLVVYAANAAMNEWGEGVLREMLKHYSVKYERRAAKPRNYLEAEHWDTLFFESRLDAIAGVPSGEMRRLRLTGKIQPREVRGSNLQTGRLYTLGDALVALRALGFDAEAGTELEREVSYFARRAAAFMTARKQEREIEDVT